MQDNNNPFYKAPEELSINEFKFGLGYYKKIKNDFIIKNITEEIILKLRKKQW